MGDILQTYVYAKWRLHPFDEIRTLRTSLPNVADAGVDAFQ